MKRFSRISIIGSALVALALLAALAVATFFANGTEAHQTAAVNATTLKTAAGLFEVSYQSDPTPPPVHKLHTWTLQVRDAGGQPVSGASISVDGGMQAHGHGLPTTPLVSQELAGGTYLVEGMKFNMPGPWEVRFTIDAGGRSDTVEFKLDLQ